MEAHLNQDVALQELGDYPWRFEFAQAMRVLLRNSDHGKSPLASDRRFDVEHEPVRIGAHQSSAFPASDIQFLESSSAGKRKMLVNFLGLTGPSGVLPLYYTELFLERISEGDKGPIEFF